MQNTAKQNYPGSVAYCDTQPNVTGLSYATLPGPHGAKKQIKQNVEPRGLQEAENYAAAYEKKRQNVETRNQYANSDLPVISQSHTVLLMMKKRKILVSVLA